jgi:hypothetical protein
VASLYHINIKFPMKGTIIIVIGELDVEEECIMLDSQDWYTSDVPTLIATPLRQAFFSYSSSLFFFFLSEKKKEKRKKEKEKRKKESKG